MRRQEHSRDSAGRPGIGRAELEVLTYVQAHHPATVRQVADHLAASRGVVRTTVLNMMSRLVAKGYLERRREAGVFVYRPRVPRGPLLRGLVRDFVQGALGGSVSPFVAYLTKEAAIGEEELAALKALVRELEARNGKGTR